MSPAREFSNHPDTRQAQENKTSWIEMRKGMMAGSLVDNDIAVVSIPLNLDATGIG